MLRIKLVKSLIGNNPRNRATVAALGLRKMQQVVEHEDTPSIRGMIHHVKHMLVVEEVVDGVVTSTQVPTEGIGRQAKPRSKAVKPNETKRENTK